MTPGERAALIQPHRVPYTILTIMDSVKRHRMRRSIFSALWRMWLGGILLTGCSKAPEPTPGNQDSASPGNSSTAIFQETTSSAGIDFVHQMGDGKLSNIMESDGAGGAILDYDGDGFMDIYLVNSGPMPVLSDVPPETPRWPNRLFRNRGNGTFEEVAQRAGVEGRGFGTTAASADYDNDGDADLLVVNFGELILYQNQGHGTFQEVTAQAGLLSQGAGISATFFDADGDGLLDLFVANYLVYDPAVKLPPGSQAPYPGPLSYEPELNILYRNRGDGTFEDVSRPSGILVPGHRAMSVTPLDYDRDGDQDLYISNDATPNLLLANDGHGRFQDAALQCGVAYNQMGEAAGSMGASLGDCNGDGFPDLLVTRFGNASLYMNSSQGLFEDRIVSSGILNVSAQYVGWGGNFLDFDNDGDLDIFIANGDPHSMKGSPSLLLENSGQATYTNAAGKGGPFLQRLVNLRGCGVFDLDNNGHLDVVLTSLSGPAFLLRHQGNTPGHWLTLKLTGRRCNRDGFGARIRVTAGQKVFYAEARCPTSYVFQHDPRLHFGLGHETKVDRIEVQWPKPSGQTQILTNVPANQVLRIEEP